MRKAIEALGIVCVLLSLERAEADPRPTPPGFDDAFSRGLRVAEDPDYGSTEERPIRVGDPSAGDSQLSGRRNRTLYLLSLRGPERQRVRYERLGSCCPDNEGGGVLDVFEVRHKGMEEPVKLFFDVYRSSEPLIPRGFTFTKTEDPNWAHWIHSWLHRWGSPAWSLEALAAYPEEDEYRQRKHAAWKKCRALPGYDLMRQSFEVVDAMLGSINLMPDSLYVDLRTTSRGLVNGVWWWNPLKDGEPLHDWRDFLRLHEDATVLISRHTWLLEWRESSPGRAVEFHALGLGIGETEFELEHFALPVWRDAGLEGDPSVKLLARRPDLGWAYLFLGDEDPRAIVTAVQNPDRSSGHWLDGLAVYFHPRCEPGDETSRYAVVQPSGSWEIRSFRGCEP